MTVYTPSTVTVTMFRSSRYLVWFNWSIYFSDQRSLSSRANCCQPSRVFPPILCCNFSQWLLSAAFKTHEFFPSCFFPLSDSLASTKCFCIISRNFFLFQITFPRVSSRFSSKSLNNVNFLLIHAICIGFIALLTLNVLKRRKEHLCESRNSQKVKVFFADIERNKANRLVLCKLTLDQMQ